MSDVLSNGLNVNVNIQPSNEPDAGNISITVLPPQNGPQGESGATFTPSVSENGILSWSNDKGFKNPDPVSIKGENGAPGQDGKSAYEIAKENGFDGTEEEWLDHLRADSDKLLLIQLRSEPSASRPDLIALKHDYTYAEIKKALDDGKFLLLRDIDGKVYDYSHNEGFAGRDDGLIFRAIGKYTSSKGLEQKTIAITTDYSASRTSYGGLDAPIKTPNPYALKFVDENGETKEEYDGSQAVIINYPMDGKDGAPGKDGPQGLQGIPGADGYSPTAKVTETADGALIEITDKNGTTSAIVKNGKDGANGEGGSIETPTDLEIIEALVEADLLLAVTDKDGAILTDANGILIM